jgi:hypothetical protein
MLRVFTLQKPAARAAGFSLPHFYPLSLIGLSTGVFEISRFDNVAAKVTIPA